MQSYLTAEQQRIIILDMKPKNIIEHATEISTNSPDLYHFVNCLTSSAPLQLSNSIVDYLYRKPAPFFNKPINSDKLRLSAKIFHNKASTETSQVRESIAAIDDNKPRIRIAHQANLFPSLAIVSQFFFLDALKNELVENGVDTSPLFVIIDYDVAGDQRFRTAHFPNIQGDLGILSLSGAIQKSKFHYPMWAINKPPKPLLEKWISQVFTLTRHHNRQLRNLMINERAPGTIRQNFDMLVSVIWDSYDQSSSLVEFNSFFLSKLINVAWQMPISFVFGHDLQIHMKCGYEFLIQNWKSISKLNNEGVDYFKEVGITINHWENETSLPLWIVCNQRHNDEICYGRVPLSVADNNSDRIIARGECKQCRFDYVFDLGPRSNPNLDAILNFNFSPRILADNLLDSISLGVAGGPMYLGGAEHMLITSYIMSKLGWEMPPHALWRPHGIYYGLEECLAGKLLLQKRRKTSVKSYERLLSSIRRIYFGKVSILYYLMNIGIEPIFGMWHEFFDKGRHLYDHIDRPENSPFIVPNDVVNSLRGVNREI